MIAYHASCNVSSSAATLASGVGYSIWPVCGVKQGNDGLEFEFQESMKRCPGKSTCSQHSIICQGVDIEVKQATCYVPKKDSAGDVGSAIGSTIGIIAAIMFCCFCCCTQIQRKCKKPPEGDPSDGGDDKERSKVRNDKRTVV
jgi:hypothetical protein